MAENEEERDETLSEEDGEETPDTDDEASDEAASGEGSSAAPTAKPKGKAKGKGGMTAGQRLAAAKAAKAAKKAAAKGKEAEIVEDEAVKRAAEATDWAQKHQRNIWAAIGAVLLVAVAVLGFNHWSSSRAASAAAALAKANDTLTARIVSEDDPEPAEEEEEADDAETFPSIAERNAAALERYRAVISDHGGSDAAVWARLGEGGVLLDQGEHQAAREAYQSALQEGGDDVSVQARALEGIAYTFEAEENWDEAIAYYDQLGDVRGAGLAETAKYHLARMNLAKGDDVRAKEGLRELLDGLREEGAPELPYVQDQAELRLLALDPSAVPRRSSPDLGGGGPGSLTPEQLQELIRQFQSQQGGAPE